MKVDEATERMMTKTMGFKLLESQEGIEAFLKGLTQTESSLSVIAGEPKKIRRIIEAKPREEKRVSLEVNEADRSEVLGKIEKEIIQIIASILKISAEEIDLEAEMSEFGFDSISFTEFSNKLNEKHNLGIMPSVFFEHPSIESFARYLLEED